MKQWAGGGYYLYVSSVNHICVVGCCYKWLAVALGEARSGSFREAFSPARCSSSVFWR